MSTTQMGLQTSSLLCTLLPLVNIPLSLSFMLQLHSITPIVILKELRCNGQGNCFVNLCSLHFDGPGFETTLSHSLFSLRNERNERNKRNDRKNARLRSGQERGGRVDSFSTINIYVQYISIDRVPYFH